MVHNNNNNNNNNNNSSPSRGSSYNALLGHAALRASSSSGNNNNSNSSVGYGDRLRRLRIEADYYGLHQLVHDIDNVTIGEKIVFEATCGWARVAGGLQVRNNNDAMNDDAAAADDAGDVGAAGNELLQDEVGADENVEDQDMQDNNADNEEEEEEEAEEEQEQEQNEDEEEQEEEVEVLEEEVVDPNEPLTYKQWSWVKQYGNPEILRPHPSHPSSMVVGQDGTYLLLLRLAAALPSPLARIKWDEEEEQGRRVTRGASRRTSTRRRGRPSDSGADSSDNSVVEEEEDDIRNSMLEGRSRELEEDYFVTVNIEAPLQTIMDSVDESQTHFPLLRTGLWDYRPEEEVLNEDPVFATFTAMDTVSLRAGDVLSISFMNEDVSRERHPFPDNRFAPELVNSLTLVKVYGNTLARYERLKTSTDDSMPANLMNNTGRRRSGTGGGDNRGILSSPLRNGIHSTPPRSNRAPRGQRYNPMEDDHRPDEEDYEPEEFDRSLTREAHWACPRNDFQSTPFHPNLERNASILQFPNVGHCLLLGRVAVGCRRDATFHSVLSGGPAEGHRAQLSVRSTGGRLLHALGFVFEDKPRLEWADLSILSENATFNDIIYVPSVGTELSITTTGDCRLHPEGTSVGPFCSAVSQTLSCLMLDEMIEVDRYMVGTIRNTSLDQREIKWFHTRSASAPSGQGKGGTLAKKSLFDIDGHRIVWRGVQNDRRPSIKSATTVLIIGSIPPLHRGYVVGLLKNNEPISISVTPESLDMKGRHCHNFHEVVELRDGDEITVAQCAFGDQQLHIENRIIEFDTRIGHLSFVVLHREESHDGE